MGSRNRHIVGLPAGEWSTGLMGDIKRRTFVHKWSVFFLQKCSAYSFGAPLCILFGSKVKLLWILRIVIIYAICINPSILPLICMLTPEDHGFDRPVLCLDSVSKATRILLFMYY